MDKFLSITRWTLHKVFIGLLGALIWIMIPTLAASINFTNPDQIKAWLVEGQVYDQVLNESLSFVELDGDGQTISEQANGGALDTDALVSAVKTAIPATFVQEQTEGVIDGTFVWLRSETSQPEFSLSLNEKSEDIEEALTKELTVQLEKLPPCTQAELEQQAMSAVQPEVLELTCLPPGVSPAEQAAIFSTDFVSQPDGLVQSEFNQDDLRLGSSANANVPVLFSVIELLPTFFWTFLIAFSAIVLITSRSIRRGLKEVGATLLFSSGVLVAMSFLGGRLASAPGKYIVDPQKSDAQAQAARNVVEPLAKNVAIDLSNTALQLSLIVMAIGAILLLAGWYLGRRSVERPTNDENEVPELLKDQDSDNFIDKVHAEKNAKPKMREKIKKRLIQ
jgi:hypothetical protein